MAAEPVPIPPAHGVLYEPIADKGSLQIRLLTGTQTPPKNIVMKKLLRVVLMGETGSGKSTSTDSFVNYLLGVRRTDNFRYKLINEDDEKRAAAKSCTTAVTSYWLSLEHIEPGLWIELVDTPGFADVDYSGNEQKNVDKIISFLERQPCIHAIFFVAKATVNKLSALQKYVVERFLTLLARDTLENIFLLATFSTSKKPLVLTPLEQVRFPTATYFPINNEVVMEPLEDESDFSDIFWKLFEQGFSRVLQRLRHIAPFSLQLTREVLKERRQIEAQVEALRSNLDDQLNIQASCEANKTKIIAARADIDAGKDFTWTELKKTSKQKPVPAGTHTTYCPNCNFTCHAECQIVGDSEKNRCSAMGADGRCTVCPNTCVWDVHLDKPYHIVHEYYKETKIIEEKQRIFEKGTKTLTRSQEMLRELEKKLDLAKARAAECVAQLRAKLDRLRVIGALAVGYGEIEYLEMLIKTERDKKEVGFLERIDALEKMLQKAKIVVDAAGKPNAVRG